LVENRDRKGMETARTVIKSMIAEKVKAFL